MMNSAYSTSVEAEKENPKSDSSRRSKDKKSKGTEKRKDRSRVNTLCDTVATNKPDPTSVEEREKVPNSDSAKNPKTNSPRMRGGRSRPGSTPRTTTTLWEGWQ